MEKLNLILLRHGRTEHNAGMRLTGWGDPPLDEVGLVQATAAAERLTSQYQIEVIYSSPLKRAHQTAEAVAKLTGLPIQLRDDLKELYFGEAEGLTIPETIQKFPELFNPPRSFDDPDFKWPGGETRLIFHTRIDQALWEIIQAEAGQHKTILIAAHGGVLAGIISQMETGQPYEWRKYLLENCQNYVVEVSCETLPVTRENTVLKIIYRGQVAPLGPNQ